MASGDEFFTPDDSYAWFDGMKDKTWLRLLPNSEHGMSLHSLSSQNIRQGFMKVALESNELTSGNPWRDTLSGPSILPNRKTGRYQGLNGRDK